VCNVRARGCRERGLPKDGLGVRAERPGVLVTKQGKRWAVNKKVVSVFERRASKAAHHGAVAKPSCEGGVSRELKGSGVELYNS
jgi:hypothetical protein